MVLNRNPDNFFAETEQVAFCTAHVIPGIDFSNDPLLHGRIHSYLDTQLTRLGGPNFHELPINAPLAPVHNNQRDGLHRQGIARGRVAVRAELPGRRLSVPGRDGQFVSFARAIEPDNSPIDKVRGKPEKFAEHYSQATLFFEQSDPPGAGPYHRRLPLRGSSRVTSCPQSASAWWPPAAQCVHGIGPGGRGWPRDRVAKGDAPRHGEATEAGIRAIKGNVADGASRRGRHRDTQGGHPDRRWNRGPVGHPGAAGAAGSRCGDSTAGQPAGHRDRLRRRALRGRCHAGEFPLRCLFDRRWFLPDGAAGVEALAKDGHTLEFLKDQYRHCKTILAYGASSMLLQKLGISFDLPSGEGDRDSSWEAPARTIARPSSKHWPNTVIRHGIAIHR